jgi:hypothetical protein
MPMQRFTIKIIGLFYLCFFQLILSMERMEAEDQEIVPMEVQDSDVTEKFAFFNDLNPELQDLIWNYYISENPMTVSFFNQIIKPYQSIKTLSLVCREFRKLENLHLKNFKKQLLEQLTNRLNKANNIDEAEGIDHADILLFSLIVKSLAEGQHINNKMLKYICKKNSHPLIALLISLRLNEIYLTDVNDKSEKDIIGEIWALLKDQSPLHLACKLGNVKLTKYLTHQVIRSYFGIDIYEEIKGKTPLMLAKENREGSNRKHFMGREPEENAQFREYYDAIVEILEKAGAMEF